MSSIVKGLGSLRQRSSTGPPHSSHGSSTCGGAKLYARTVGYLCIVKMVNARVTNHLNEEAAFVSRS